MWNNKGTQILLLLLCTCLIEDGFCNGESGKIDDDPTDNEEGSGSSEIASKSDNVSTSGIGDLSTGAIIGLSVFLVIAIIVGGVCGGYCRFCRRKVENPGVAPLIYYVPETQFQCDQDRREPISILQPPPYTQIASDRIILEDPS